MRPVALALAVITGLLILAGYFVAPLSGLLSILLNWAIIVAGSATIVGVFNLILVHGTRIHNRERGGAYSALLLVSLFATFIFGLALGPDHPEMRRLIGAIIVPVESSLMALLAVSLLYGAMRLLRRRAELMSVVFLATAVLMMLASATLPFGDAIGLHNFIRPWLQHVLSLGGARGMLIGIALGTLVTGLRVLLGAERPYEAG
jgi:hypothetical protein